VVNVVGIGAMIATALLLEWFKAAGRRPPGSRPRSRQRSRQAAIRVAPSESPQ
jgi:hypothetical protein